MAVTISRDLDSSALAKRTSVHADCCAGTMIVRLTDSRSSLPWTVLKSVSCRSSVWGHRCRRPPQESAGTIDATIRRCGRSLWTFRRPMTSGWLRPWNSSIRPFGLVAVSSASTLIRLSFRNGANQLDIESMPAAVSPTAVPSPHKPFPKSAPHQPRRPSPGRSPEPLRRHAWWRTLPASEAGASYVSHDEEMRTLSS